MALSRLFEQPPGASNQTIVSHFHFSHRYRLLLFKDITSQPWLSRLQSNILNYRSQNKKALARTRQGGKIFLTVITPYSNSLMPGRKGIATASKNSATPDTRKTVGRPKWSAQSPIAKEQIIIPPKKNVKA